MKNLKYVALGFLSVSSVLAGILIDAGTPQEHRMIVLNETCKGRNQSAEGYAQCDVDYPMPHKGPPEPSLDWLVQQGTDCAQYGGVRDSSDRPTFCRYRDQRALATSPEEEKALRAARQARAAKSRIVTATEVSFDFFDEEGMRLWADSHAGASGGFSKNAQGRYVPDNFRQPAVER